jgi:hypothetical protein
VHVQAVLKEECYKTLKIMPFSQAISTMSKLPLVRLKSKYKDYIYESKNKDLNILKENHEKSKA